MSRLEDFRVYHAVEIQWQYRRSAFRWKIPEGQWAAAIYRVAMTSGSPGSRWSSANEMSCTLAHPDDFAFALAVRLGCSRALESFEAKYKIVLHDLALDIAHDESRAMNSVEAVWQEIYGELEEDGRRRSLLQEFDGSVSLLDWLRAVMERRVAGGLDATGPKYDPPTSRPAPAQNSCPPHAAVAAYHELVRLGGAPHLGRRLRLKERAQIRHHLRACVSCQTRLATGRANGRYSGQPQGAASERRMGSSVWPLRAMGIAGIVGILAWAAWLTGQPQRFVGRASTILRAAVSQARDPAEARRTTPIDGGTSSLGAESQLSEASEHPHVAELSTAQSSQSTSGDKTRATSPPDVAPPRQVPDSGLDTKVVADFSKTRDFSLGEGSAVTTKNRRGARESTISGTRRAKRPKKRTPYHIESDRLYTKEQTNSLIQRLGSLGYAADATPVETGHEPMYRIKIGAYQTADEADDAADDLEARYNATFTPPPH